MPREEQISVKLVKSGDYQGMYKKLQMEAEELKKSFASIKIGDAKGYAALAKAEKDLATAALNRAKADKVAAEAATAKLKTAQQQAKTDIANAKAQTQLAKSATDLAKAEIARQKAQQASIDTATKQIKQQKEASNAISAAAKSEKELANAETARQKGIQATINTTTAQIKQQKELENAQTAYQKRLKATYQAESAQISLEQKKESVLEKSARVYRQLGTEIGNVDKTKAKSYTDMANYIRQIDGLENATVKATGVIRNSAGTFQTYTASVQNADGTTRQYKFSVEDAEGSVYKLDQGLRMTATGANTFGNAISKAGKTLLSSLKTLVGYYGIVQSLRYAFKEMKSMSDEMIVYQKITKATAEEMDRIRAASYDVAKRYGQTPTDFLSAAQEMARAGYKERSADMAELAIKTKLVGDITADQASKFLLAVDAGYKFGGSIEKLSMVLDQANEIGNNYATSIDKISEGMTLVASLGAQANVSIEELMAALGTMTAATQRSGSEMARALRFIMLGVLGDTTTEVEEGVTITAEEVESLTTALQHYAPAVVEAAKASGKLINPMEAIGALAKAYKQGLLGGEEELFKIAKELAGQRYYNAFAALIANWDDMYLEMLDKEKEAAGSADAEINVLMSGWTQKLNVLKTTWTEVVNKTIQEGFIKDLIDGSTAALKFAGSLENLGMMAGGAIVAVKALSASLKSISSIRNAALNGIAVSDLTKIGSGFSIATSIASFAVGIVGVIKSAREAAARAAIEAAQEQLSKTEKEIEKYREIYNISEKYKKIYSDGIATDEEKSQLISMQEQLNSLLGDQAKSIDIVNGKYEDMQKAIDNAVLSQQQLTEAEILRAKNEAIAAFQVNISGGTLLVGDNYPYSDIFDSIENYEKYFPGVKGGGLFDNSYKYNSPRTFEEMMEFYGVVVEMLNTMDSIDKYAEDYAYVYRYFLNLKQNIENTGVVRVQEMIDASQKLKEETESAAEVTDDAAKASEDAGKAMEGEAKAANQLAQAIHNATKAKEKFDEAMKSTKADAMNSYASAYSTLETEIKEGRVNSTAFYAAARMILGDDMFAMSGGNSITIRQMLNNRGASGSMLDALDILNATYKDKDGNVVQGLGVYELLSKTKGIDQSQLVTSDGKLRVPDFTESELKEISRQWGGIAPDMLKAWFNALDQYDILGSATTDVQKALESEEKSAAKTLEDVATNGDAAAKALDAVAEAADKLAGDDGATSTGAFNKSNGKGASPFTTLAFRMLGDSGSAGMTEGGDVQHVEKKAQDVATDAVLAATENVGNAIKQATNGESMIEGGDVQHIEEQALDIATSAVQSAMQKVSDVIGLPQTGQSTDDKLAQIFGYSNDAELISVVQKIMRDTYSYQMEREKATGQHYDATNALNAMLEGYAADISDWNLLTEKYKEAVARLQQQAKENPVQIEADTTEAEKEVQNFIEKIPGQVAVGIRTYSIGGVNVYSDTTHNTGGTSPKSFLPDLFAGLHLYASGTQGHPGGPALLNDGNGPELVVDRGRAFIAGGGRPTVMNLHRGAKVFTAGQTSAMLGRSSIPAYAEGTPNSESAGGGVAGFIASLFDLAGYTREKPEEDKKESVGGNGGNSGPKVDKQSYEELKTLMDYILDRIGAAIEEQQEENKLAELQKNLTDALNERTVRYLGEDGKWHWMADASKVQAAQKELNDYQQEYEYNQILKTWQDIQAAVNTPTGDIDKLLSNILKNGTAPQKKAAEYIQSLLIGNLLQGGSYSGNYAEALTAIQAANAGSPFMPTELSYTLSSLIANTGARESVGDVTDSLMMTASGASVNGTARGTVYGSPQTFYNYYINGLELGSDQANRPLSDILQDLTVYTNATVH